MVYVYLYNIWHLEFYIWMNDPTSISKKSRGLLNTFLGQVRK